MWTFENPPLGYLEEEYGFKPDQKWLDTLRLSSLRFGTWCSSSFVSPMGLIMTNHHCVRDNIADVQGMGNDYVKDSFYATSYDDELPLEDREGNPLKVYQLAKTVEITDKINEGVTAEDDDAAVQEKRDANKKKILEAAETEHEGFEPEVVKLYAGGIFQLYLYKVYDDVRLVCSPHLQTAHFGGDPDNFTYPRYSIDFSFCRAYEDGKPADTAKHYFKWSKAGAKDGDLVFVTGNPGSTERLLTKAQMDLARDVSNPIGIDMLDSQLGILRGFAESNPRFANAMRQQILGLENSQKATKGYQSGLLDEKLMAQKVKAEAAFKKRAAEHPELGEASLKIWDRLADAAQKLKGLEPKASFYSPSYSGPLSMASLLCQSLDPAATEEEREKASKELKGDVRQGRNRNIPFYDVLFANHMELAQKWLPAADPYLTLLLGDGSIEDLRQSLNEDPLAGREGGEILRQLSESDWETVQKSEVNSIVIARQLHAMQGEVKEQVEKLQAIIEAQGAELGKVLFACYGTKVSPDATMTPRFSDGLVAGYPYNGTKAPYRTTFYGLYGRNKEFDNQYPFNVPQVWLDKKDKVDMNMSVNFVSTNDIIGGNSGSPIVNKDLEVVGLIFDGNIESLPNKYVFKDEVERSVSVHTQAIMESLSKIYDATRVANELMGKLEEYVEDEEEEDEEVEAEEAATELEPAQGE